MTALDQLLPALELKARREPGAFTAVVDRELAAFISVRLKRKITVELSDLEYDKDPYIAPIAAARILAIVQEESRTPPVPALCSIVAKTLQKPVDQFHSRERRARATSELETAGETGQFGMLLEIVNDDEALAEDQAAYEQAVEQYRRTVSDLARVEFERENRGRLSRQLGAELVALLSGALSTLATLGIVLIKFF